MHEDSKNGRVQMDVQMAVDVIERQAGGVEFCELRGDFVFELFDKVLFEEIAHSGRCGGIGKLAFVIDKPRNLLRGKRAGSAEECQV